MCNCTCATNAPALFMRSMQAVSCALKMASGLLNSRITLCHKCRDLEAGVGKFQGVVRDECVTGVSLSGM